MHCVPFEVLCSDVPFQQTASLLHIPQHGTQDLPVGLAGQQQAAFPAVVSISGSVCWLMCPALALNPRGNMLGESWQQRSSNSQVWQWSAEGLSCSFLQVSQSMLEHKCFPLLAFSKSWLCSYDQHSAEAEVGWGLGRHVILGAGIVNQALSNITLLLLKMIFLNPVEFGLVCSVV